VCISDTSDYPPTRKQKSCCIAGTGDLYDAVSVVVAFVPSKLTDFLADNRCIQPGKIEIRIACESPRLLQHLTLAAILEDEDICITTVPSQDDDVCIFKAIHFHSLTRLQITRLNSSLEGQLPCHACSIEKRIMSCTQQRGLGRDRSLSASTALVSVSQTIDSGGIISL